MMDYYKTTEMVDSTEAKATAPKVAHGDWIKLPAYGDLMDALRKAGMLEVLGTQGTVESNYPYWGIDLEPDADGTEWVLVKLVKWEAGS